MLVAELLLASLAAQNVSHYWSHATNLARATTTTLGWVSLEHLGDESLALHWEHTNTAHTGYIWSALLKDIGALLAVKLGANSQGNIEEVLQVLGTTLSATWALVELCLGIVHLSTLGSLGDVLALTSHHNNTTFGV
jgi:hypothetical protein